MKARIDEHGILLLTRHGQPEMYAQCPIQTTVMGDISCSLNCPLFRVEIKDVAGVIINKLHFCHNVSYEVDELIMGGGTMELIHGDCLEEMKGIPDGSVDMVLTDIPYNEVNRHSNGLRNLNKGKADELTFDLKKALEQCNRICTGSFYIFCGTEQVSKIRGYLVSIGCTTRLCIWEKTNPSPMNGEHVWLSGVECCVYGKKSGATFNGFCENTVFRYPVPKSKLHPTMKPIQLIERLIKASSNERDTVLDFTMGSGTTGVACVKTNRKFIGIEKDKQYFKIAQDRIRKELAQGDLFRKPDINSYDSVFGAVIAGKIKKLDNVK